MSDTETPITDASAITVAPAKPHRLGRWLAGFAIVGAALGFAGGLATHAIFPAKNGVNGQPGAQGPAGEAGPSGPQGPAGNNTDLGTVGYCFNTSYFDNQTYGIDYIDNVSLTAPVNTNGVDSCPSGTFVPLQPTTPTNT
jgi:hypothetical protein